MTSQEIKKKVYCLASRKWKKYGMENLKCRKHSHSLENEKQSGMKNLSKTTDKM